MQRTTRVSLFVIATAIVVALGATTAVAGSPSFGGDRKEKSRGEKKAEKATRVLREATGIRFSVFESYIRRSIISTKTPYGFKIRAVDKGSPAAKAGLRYGDIVLHWNGKPVKTVGTVAKWIQKAKPGEKIVLEVASRRRGPGRGGFENREVTIVLRTSSQKPAPKGREI